MTYLPNLLWHGHCHWDEGPPPLKLLAQPLQALLLRPLSIAAQVQIPADGRQRWARGQESDRLQRSGPSPDPWLWPQRSSYLVTASNREILLRDLVSTVDRDPDACAGLDNRPVLVTAGLQETMLQLPWCVSGRQAAPAAQAFAALPFPQKLFQMTESGSTAQLTCLTTQQWHQQLACNSQAHQSEFSKPLWGTVLARMQSFSGILERCCWD